MTQVLSMKISSYNSTITKNSLGMTQERISNLYVGAGVVKDSVAVPGNMQISTLSPASLKLSNYLKSHCMDFWNIETTNPPFIMYSPVSTSLTAM